MKLSREANGMIGRVAVLAMVLLLAGCVTTDDAPPHVLSGEAPLEDVLAKAQEAYQSGDMEASAILLQIALKQEPSADTWYKLGLTEARRGRTDAALFAYSQALHSDQNHVGTLERLSLYYTTSGDADRARDYLSKLLAASPENWRAYNAMGVLADREENYQDARKYYTKALQIRPDLPMLWNNLGYSLYLLGEYTLAEKYIRRSLELDPKYDPARMNLGLLHVHNEHYQAALDTFLQRHDEASSYTHVGYLAYQIGQLETAEAFLKEGIRRSPTYNKPAHEYLAATRKALARSDQR